MDKLLASLKRDGFILSALVSRDFKLKYRRSILGVLWSVLNPLLMMMVLTAVFSFMFRFNIDNFPLYLILGTILFNFMSNATNASLDSVIASAPLIKKIRVNKVLFPLEKVIFELINFLISLVAVVIVMVYFAVAPSVNLLFLPLLLLYMLLFCTGLSLILATLAVFFRDLVHLWGVFTLAWTYATPLFYPVDMLPAMMQNVMQYNPMYQYVTYFREIVLWHTSPSLEQNLICLGMALVTFVVGILVFKRLQSRFILFA